MIISHKYKYIFLKTSKTAGTSIEIALSKFCGPDDIITPIFPEDEKLRQELGYRGPQNYQFPLRESRLNEIPKYLFSKVRKNKFYNHMPAVNIRALLPKHIWETYTRFCFERNPWARMVSEYYWLYKDGPLPSFSGFINSSAPIQLKQRAYGIYTINGIVVAKKIFMFEQLKEAVETLRQDFGLPEPLELPRAKVLDRKDRKDYHDLFGEAEIERVRHIFREEIAMFNYEY